MLINSSRGHDIIYFLSGGGVEGRYLCRRGRTRCNASKHASPSLANFFTNRCAIMHRPPTGSLRPVVDLTVGASDPLSTQPVKPIQSRIRSCLGVAAFLLILFGIGVFPVAGIPPLLYFLHWMGLCPHWPIRRVFDLCVAHWMSIITVKVEVTGNHVGFLI